MEIKQVGDLIPYHKSLQELWAKEEFQPVLLLVKALWDEAITDVRRANLDIPGEDCKANLAVFKTKLNMTNLIFNLPAMVKEAENQIQTNQFKKDRFAKAQEGGLL